MNIFKSLILCTLAVLPLTLIPVPMTGQDPDPAKPITAKKLETLLQKARKEHKLPAMGASILHGDQKPMIAVVGIRKKGEQAAASIDDKWHLGSNTKPMTALLIALLIDMGLLDWETPLDQIFPDLAKEWGEDRKKITLEHLLTHTSGLPANWPFGWFFIAGKGTPAEQRVRMMENLRNVTLKSKPGMEYTYSNLGYTVLGVVIDRVTKSSWEEQMQKKIFEALGIKHAGFGPTGVKDKLLHPWPHRKSGDPVESGVLDNPDIMNPAGRVHMPLADYNRFLAESLRLARGEKGLLKPDTAKRLFTNPIKQGPHSLSGWLGICRNPNDKDLVLIHDGSNSMNYCTAAVVPSRNLTFCICTNQGGDDASAACTKTAKELLKRTVPK